MQRAIRSLIDLLIVGIFLFGVTSAWATPTTSLQAQQVVQNWLSLDRAPLGAQLGRRVKEVRTYRDSSGQPWYYIVYLYPAGFAVVSADDLVEPIIGFIPKGTYDPSLKNPLGALVSQDVRGRLAQVRGQEAQARVAGREFTPVGAARDARRKWNLLQQKNIVPRAKGFGPANISDVRVAPLLQSAWDQSAVGSEACFNYYTPPNPAGSASNYVCGCVATAMSQLLRYYQKPTAGVGTAAFQISVAGVSRYENLRGGNGNGGPYDWNNMPLTPFAEASLTEAQRQAIGALTHDAGVSVNMDYNTEALGSGADTLKSAEALKNTFGYSNAKKGYNDGLNLPGSNLYNMVNPNLDASWPVLFGATGPTGGHAIACDGYGYNSGTLYHHLNMGWVDKNGVAADNVWYNLPNMDAKIAAYNVLIKCVYNIFVSGSGGIISGRVAEPNGAPLSSVTITATGSGGPYTAVTNSNGIYALGRIPANSSFTVAASKAGYSFNTQKVKTGASTDNTATTGNLWGINFTGDVISGWPPLTLNLALDNANLSFSTGGHAEWFAEITTWRYGEAAAQSGTIAADQSSWMETTAVGPGNLSFFWKVSSAPDSGFLEFYLDGVLQPGRLSGEVDWVQKTCAIPAGSHTVRWQYDKSASGSAGSDCGWVDKVAYTRNIDPALLLLLQQE